MEPCSQVNRLFVIGPVVVNTNDLFEFLTVTQTRGHRYKLFKKSNNRNIRTTVFCERVINIWNKLPADTDVSSLSKFKLIITTMTFRIIVSSLYLSYSYSNSYGFTLSLFIVFLYTMYSFFLVYILCVGQR